MTPLDIIIGLLALVAVWGGWRMTAGAARKRTLARIDRIRQRKVTVARTGGESLRRKAEESKGLVYWLMKPLPDFDRLGEKLERAGKTITPKKFVFRCGITVLAIVAVGTGLLGKAIYLTAPLALFIGLWLPFKLLDHAIDKQNKAFLRLFPDALDLIVRGLRSGLPVSESLVLVSHEVPEPVGGIFNNVANTMKLGVPMEKALLDTAKRLKLTEFNFFTTSIVLQRETGGNLSEILNNLSEVLRGRYIMRMKVVALSSEARASAKIIGALPFVVVGAVSILSPDYMKPLMDDPNGNICAAVAAGMMGFGMFVMNRMTQFEI